MVLFLGFGFLINAFWNINQLLLQRYHVIRFCQSVVLTNYFYIEITVV